MTQNEAKEILRARRPWMRDDEDHEVLEALQLARRDSELASWLEQQSAFHETIRAQLRAFTAPEDLREALLSGRRKIIPMWRRPEFFLAAACLLLALVLGAMWAQEQPRWARGAPEEDQTFNGFRSRMVGFALRLYRMDIMTSDLNQVLQFLQEQGAPSQLTLTPGLEAMPVKGGAALTWQGHPVSMVCFHLAKTETLYMFVMEQRALQQSTPPGPKPEIQEVGGISTASWSHDGKVYIVAARRDAIALERLLTAEKQPEALVAGLCCLGAGPAQEPEEIGAFAVFQLERQAGCIRPGRRLGARDDPVTDFGVAIGESQAA
jgi:hypothetical protein